eukprot:scaffold167175_cov42-Cyclotella_meneghiniana.AAC.5
MDDYGASKNGPGEKRKTDIHSERRPVYLIVRSVHATVYLDTQMICTQLHPTIPHHLISHSRRPPLLPLVLVPHDVSSHAPPLQDGIGPPRHALHPQKRLPVPQYVERAVRAGTYHTNLPPSDPTTSDSTTRTPRGICFTC